MVPSLRGNSTHGPLPNNLVTTQRPIYFSPLLQDPGPELLLHLLLLARAVAIPSDSVASQDQLAGLTSDRLLEVERVLTSNHGFLDRALLASPGDRLPARHRCLHGLCCRWSAALRVEREARSSTGVASSPWPAPTPSPRGPRWFLAPFLARLPEFK
jgi:hypothetical protein